MPHTLSPDLCNLYPPAARHYNNSDLSIWLSVDPMSDKGGYIKGEGYMPSLPKHQLMAKMAHEESPYTFVLLQSTQSVYLISVICPFSTCFTPASSK